MTIRREIVRFRKEIRYEGAIVAKKIAERLHRFCNNLQLLDQEIELIRNKKEQLVMQVEDGIRSYTRDRTKLVHSLHRFFNYLENHYGINFNLDEYIRQDEYLEQYERHLKLLKLLHEKPKTRQAIAEQFGISERTLANDLKLLQDGEFSFLGYEMKIDVERGTNTYDSTIHPTFLPLNLSEVYALTVGLKLLGNKTLFADIYRYIADSIFSQLSDYGKRIIKAKGEEVNVSFSQVPKKSYRYETELLQEQLDQGRAGMYAYFLKSGHPCTIEYNDNGKIKRITGKITYVTNKRNVVEHDKINVQTDDTGEIQLDLSDILHISFAK